MPSVVFYLVAFAALPVGWVAVTIFKDVRGGRRNARNLCYACGKKMMFPTVVFRPVPRGESVRYVCCRACARVAPNGPDMSYVWLIVAVVAGAAAYEFLFR